MPRHFISLPPELLLHIAEVADYGSLCSLLRTSRFLHFLLWPILYRRETAQSNPVGFLRSIRLGSASAVSKFIAVNADVNAKIEPGDCQDFTGYTYPLATAVVRDQRDIVGLLLQNGANPNARINGFLCHTILADHIHPWAGVLSSASCSGEAPTRTSGSPTTTQRCCTSSLKMPTCRTLSAPWRTASQPS